MKRVCILSTDANVAEAREIAKVIADGEALKVPVSAKGEHPATHWFCCLSTTDEGFTKLLELQKSSVIEESGPKEFLSKWKLKIIK
jgi:hypothetical protein